ncbi:Fibroblast growth factor receptor, partial [Orchesella cincta]
VIHGDLSARNILLTECLTAKVSDFGLSRKMYSYTHYTKNGDDPLPWRWLALESLKNLQFSSASDAWSFGIFLWEIFTLCEQPYPGVPSLTNNFIINLEEGLRPTFPQFATSDMYVMMFVGTHKHVVSLVGCCTAKLRDGILFIVLEYCVNGSLERHMKLNRPNFQNLVQKGKILGNKKPVVLEPEDENPNYMKAIPNSNVCMQKRQFNNLQLINWSIEVAKGMEFLSSKRVIHGDLSARNVLLTEHIEAKISDFGLSRKMYSYTHYTKDGEEPLPWRWLALECLKNLQFSTASDVWSFGILLFEICTLGEQPYPGVSSLTNNFIINLEEGLRPAFPLFATSDIYNIMSSCWDENPSRRPTFSRLVLTIEEARAACNKFPKSSNPRVSIALVTLGSNFHHG